MPRFISRVLKHFRIFSKVYVSLGICLASAVALQLFFDRFFLRSRIINNFLANNPSTYWDLLVEVEGLLVDVWIKFCGRLWNSFFIRTWIRVAGRQTGCQLTGDAVVLFLPSLGQIKARTKKIYRPKGEIPRLCGVRILRTLQDTLYHCGHCVPFLMLLRFWVRILHTCYSGHFVLYAKWYETDQRWFWTDTVFAEPFLLNNLLQPSIKFVKSSWTLWMFFCEYEAGTVQLLLW